jgi:hypothetical protein
MFGVNQFDHKFGPYSKGVNKLVRYAKYMLDGQYDLCDELYETLRPHLRFRNTINYLDQPAD